MAAYLLRRLWQMIPTLAGVVLLVFVLFKFFGGDPAEILGGLNATPEQIEAIRQSLGLDQPWWYQLWLFVKSIVTFDWGKSWATNEAVSNLFATRLPATLTVMMPDPRARRAAGTADRDVGGLPPRLADRPHDHGRHHRGAVDQLPGLRHRRPVRVRLPARLVPGAGLERLHVWTNLVTYAPLPVLLAVMVGLAPQTRLYRSFLLDELGQDYVRTARAKGMTEGVVLFKHVLRNAMIPILTNIGLALPGIFVGSFLIEVFFSIPGLGREVLLAVNRSDYPVIQAVTVYLAVLTMVINLLTDVMYKFADPRVVLK